MTEVSSARVSALLATVALSLAACGNAGTTADESAQVEEKGEADAMPSITLKYTDSGPKNARTEIIAFQEEVTEKTDGNITFENFWSSALMSGEESLDGVGAGVADMSQIATSYYPELLPLSNFLLQLAYDYSDSFPTGILQASGATYEVFKSDVLTAEFADQNLHVIAGAPSAPDTLLCTDPVNDVASAEGKTVRTGGQVWSDEVRALGMTPVSLPVGEMYQGLQRGVIDCVVQPVYSYKAYGLWEVADEFTPIAFSGFPGYVLTMNADTWASIPTEYQKIIEDAGTSYVSHKARFALEEYRVFATEGVDQHGINFNDATELNAILRTYQTNVARELDMDDTETTLKAYYEDLQAMWAELIDASFDSVSPGDDVVAAYAAADSIDIDGFRELLMEGGE